MDFGVNRRIRAARDAVADRHAKGFDIGRSQILGDQCRVEINGNGGSMGWLS